MTAKKREPITIRGFDSLGIWESNYKRHRSHAHDLLFELEDLAQEVLAKWPEGAGSAIQNEERHPEVWVLAKRRDRTSDAVRIYASMAVEGLLNCYGVVTLGQAVFDEHFERLGLVPKLRQLLITAAQLNIPKNDPFVRHLENLAASRNKLVHPRTIEVKDLYSHKRSAVKIPDVARQAVGDMEAFFEGFFALHSVTAI